LILIAFFIKDGTVELRMSQVVSQEAVIRLLVDRDFYQGRVLGDGEGGE
jgi:hypothetical protein